MSKPKVSEIAIALIGFGLISMSLHLSVEIGKLKGDIAVLQKRDYETVGDYEFSWKCRKLDEDASYGRVWYNTTHQYRICTVRGEDGKPPVIILDEPI